MITTNIGSGSVYLYMYVSGCLSGVFKIQKECILVSMRFIGTCFIKKYVSPPLPYFKVNICPLPLPHFASIFFAYL